MSGLGDLSMRRLQRELGGRQIHVSVDAGIDDRDDFDAGEVPCCMSSAMRGPRACTCWEPVFDLEQSGDLQSGPPAARAARCHDCAYRADSPERADGYGPDLEELGGDGSRFYCHQGMRRAVAYRHPDGRVIPAGDGDYQPPVVGQRAYRADGAPAELCAGWRRAHARAGANPQDFGGLA